VPACSAPPRTSALALLALLGCAARRSGTDLPPPPDSHLTGRPESLLVLGDADSFAWPVLLQDLLACHAGPIRVWNASFEAAEKRAWVGEAGAAAAHSIAEMGAPPRLVLCVPTLGDIATDAGTGQAALERGAGALEGLARALHAAGVAEVAFTAPFDPRGPGLVESAIETLLARGPDHVVAGPDLGTASRRYGTDALSADGGLNEFGVKLVAEEWYRWLTGSGACEEDVQDLYSRSYDVRAIAEGHARTRSGMGP